MDFPVPYRSRLQDSIEPGQTLTVKGRTLPDTDRFEVNLTANDGDNADIQLHCNARFGEDRLILNTFKDGEWGKEQRERLPFKAGEEFDLRIRVHDDGFEILCNKEKRCHYDHRAPLSHVTHVKIDGLIELQTVYWGGRYYPMPYEMEISGGFRPGKKLHVSGKPTGKRFHINLLNAEGDVALHFNPRFDDHVIVRNSKVNGEWMTEETEGEMKFKKGNEFDIVLANETYALQCYCDNQLFCAFAHRMSADSIQSLEINGDVEISGIQVV